MPAVNSALQRAHAAMREHLPERRSEWPADVDATAAERALLDRYVEHSEQSGSRGPQGAASEDVRFSMPPQPGVVGRPRPGGASPGSPAGSAPARSDRCGACVTRANRQPAVACYVRRPGDDRYTPMAIDVLRVAGGAVADIVTFDGSVFGWFGLPEAL